MLDNTNPDLALDLEQAIRPADRFGYVFRGIKKTDRDLALLFPFLGPKGEFVIWLRSADAEGGAYKQNGHYKVGFYQPPPDEPGWALVEAFCNWVFGLDRPIVLPQEKEEDPIRPQHELNPNEALSLPEELKRLPPQIGVHATRVRLAITTRCNERCPFCSSPSEYSVAVEDKASIESAISIAAETGFKEVEVSGGEPTLHPELPNIIEIAHQSGLRVWLQTNGRVPKKYWDELYARGAMPENATVSFHTAKPERVAKLTGVRGGFERKVMSVNRLVTLGASVELNFVLSTLNLDEAADFPDFVANAFGWSVGIAFSFISPDGRARYTPHLIPRLRDAGPAIEAALERAAAIGLRAWVVGYCGVPPCAIKRFRERLEHDARHESSDNPAMTKIASCERCIYNRQCRGFWKRYIEIHGPEDLIPIETPSP